MAKNKYAYQGSEGTEKTARAAGRSLQISPKHAVEICREIRGMYLDEAKEYLEDVIQKKRAVPFRRHNKKVGHRRGLTVGLPAGIRLKPPARYCTYWKTPKPMPNIVEWTLKT